VGVSVGARASGDVDGDEGVDAGVGVGGYMSLGLGSKWNCWMEEWGVWKLELGELGRAVGV
jgi:hypothetical protein